MKTRPEIAVPVGKMANNGLVGLREDNGLLTNWPGYADPSVSASQLESERLDDQLQDLSLSF